MREAIEDEERSGRSVTDTTLGNIEGIRSIVNDGSCVTIAEFQKHSGRSSGTVHRVLSDRAEFRKITAHYVPKELTDHPPRNKFEYAMKIGEDSKNEDGIYVMW